MTAPTGVLDTGALLSIDVDAEIRKLAMGSLAGPWELPTELVRWACARRAARVEVALQGRGLTLVAQAAPLGPDELRDLETVLDERAAPAARHRALLALEASPGPNLLALAALDADALELRGDGLTLSKTRGRSPRLESCKPSSHVRLSVAGARFEPGRARAELLGACRFAHVPVCVDGQDARAGFEQAWAETRLPAPLQGRLALVRGLRSTRLRLTVRGIVAGHLTVPGAPPFDAVLSADDWLAPGASPGALREAVQPHVRAIVSAAVELLLREARRPQPPAAHEQADLVHGLLTAARRRLRLGEVLQVPLIEARRAGAPAGRLSLLQLGEELERRRGAPLEALEPSQDASQHVLRAPLLLLVDGETRARLLDLLGARFVTPPRRQPVARLRRLGLTLAGLPQALRRAWSRARRPAALRPDARTRGESALLAALEGEGGRLDLRLCAGASLPFQRGRAELWLPRDARVVRLAVRALECDPSLAGAALDALRAAAGWSARA